MPSSGEPRRWFSVQEASGACDISLRCFVRELLIGSRDILHPPALPPTHGPLATGHTSPLSCLVKRQWAVSHDVVFRCEEPTPPCWERAALLPTGTQGLYSLLFSSERSIATYSGWQESSCLSTNTHFSKRHMQIYNAAYVIKPNQNVLMHPCTKNKYWHHKCTISGQKKQKTKWAASLYCLTFKNKCCQYNGNAFFNILWETLLHTVWTNAWLNKVMFSEHDQTMTKKWSWEQPLHIDRGTKTESQRWGRLNHCCPAAFSPNRAALTPPSLSS